MKENLTELIREMIAVDYCDSDLVKVGQTWLDCKDNGENANSVATDLISELEQCIVPIDDAIALAKSHPGIEFWENILALELKAKEDGMTICGCIACVNGQKILDKKEHLFN